MKTIVARWESRSGKHWVNLVSDQWGYGYESVSCGGWMGQVSYASALASIQGKIDMGYFQPDANKLPMQRVK